MRILMLVLLVLAAPAGAGEPPQPRPRAISATVLMEPSAPCEGEPIRFRCTLRNESAAPVVLLRASLEANSPGIGRSWSFVEGPLRADSVLRDGAVLHLVRRRVTDPIRPWEARQPREPYLDGASATDLVALRRVLRPGEAVQVEFAGQAVPLAGSTLDATLRVESRAAGDGVAWGAAAPTGPWSEGTADASVVEDYLLRARAADVRSGDLVTEAWVAGGQEAVYRLLVPVAPGVLPLRDAAARAGFRPRDAAWLPAGEAWFLEGAEGSALVTGTEAVPYPGRLAAWFRELSLREGPALLSDPADSAAVRRALAGLPNEEAKAGRVWRVPLAELPRRMVALMKAGLPVGPGGRLGP